MKYALVIWKECAAGNNVKNRLLKLYDFKEDGRFDDNKIYSFRNVKLYTSKTRHVNCENIDEKLKEDVIIFLTTHRSVSKKPSLCVHSTGNFGEAELGGEDNELSICFPSLMKEIFLEIKKQNNLEEFEVTLETVHHGPLLRKKPSLFVEIGSSEKEWSNEEVGRIIAKSVMNVLNRKIKKYRIGIGFGGMHYNQMGNKILEKTNIAIGCICPKYQLENLDEDLIKQMVNRSYEKVEFALLDWKGLGGYKVKVVRLLEELKLEYKKLKEIKK